MSILHSVLIRCPSWAIFLCALLSGAMQTLAFAPLGWWPLQLASLSCLFGLLYQTVSVRRTMQFTWLYCFSWLFFGVSWLAVTMYRYGGMPVWLSFVCVALFTAALAGLPALLMGL